MESFATLEDLKSLWREMTPEETERATALLPIVSDTLRLEAEKVGVDLDDKRQNSVFASVLKSVTVDVVARTLMTATDKEPMVQESQSALGYSWSGTFLTPGGGLFIKTEELKRLGLKKQRMGAIHLYGEDKRNPDCFIR
ncbi:phage Gp19/Gp15/Gp42 family protein [Facklamia sp. 7083-14-GEN3]|uniref:phage Gp19/Gp15/Gp42 family protein n=1 Tax=Facklamia sp. 7083-14-GEN3 TaxID=2973478 RepID=UPI00215D3C34|nr:phage Gp19/Gp15/Gp42 family protein [Facklamia sp. 7083-14-GEN3]MCR8969277.1 phage Gp19/Gp15/Gp42 family protein [Facklamia sp. 7083-14-GEN3]